MSVEERKLTPSEKRKLKRYEKETPKKDFTDRYGKKKGEEIYYATLTKMAKKKKKKVDEMYSTRGTKGYFRIQIRSGEEEHAGHVERSQHQGLQNVMQDQLELEAKSFHWDEPDWHYDGGYGDPEGPDSKWYLGEEELEEKKDRKGASASYCKKTPCDKMGFTQKASCKSQGIKDCYRGKKNEGKDPKVGTGKKPKGSGRRLYTDEDPSDTVSVEFSSVAAIKRTLAKSTFKSKSHKRQSQIINLIHQRDSRKHLNMQRKERKPLRKKPKQGKKRMSLCFV